MTCVWHSLPLSVLDLIGLFLVIVENDIVPLWLEYFVSFIMFNCVNSTIVAVILDAFGQRVYWFSMDFNCFTSCCFGCSAACHCIFRHSFSHTKHSLRLSILGLGVGFFFGLFTFAQVMYTVRTVFPLLNKKKKRREREQTRESDLCLVFVPTSREITWKGKNYLADHLETDFLSV